jgi:TonB-like protein
MSREPFNPASSNRQADGERPVGVYLGAHVARDVWMAVLEGSDLEVGGLLLGAGDGDVRIESVQPLPIEHRYGPSFLLTSVDVDRWQRVIIQTTGHGQTEVIGHFRSLRVDGSEIGEAGAADADHAVADLLYVQEPILLVIPIGAKNFGESLVYRRVNGNWLPLLRCPLEKIPSIPPPPPTEVAAALAPVPQPARVPSRRRPFAAWILGITAAAVLLASLVLLRRPQPPPSGGTSEIGLVARPAKGGITVLWNRESSAVRQSMSGILTIQDGDQRRELTLSRDELLSGSVFYVPATSRIEIRIQVYRDRDHYRGESLSVSSGATPPPPTQALPPEAPRPNPPARRAPSPRPQDAERMVRETASSPPKIVARPAVPLAFPPTRPPTSEPAMPSPPQVSAAPPAIAADALQKLSSVLPAASAPPPTPSISFVAAVPVRKIAPAVPANLRALVRDTVTVDVKVVIDASGNVLSATPMGASTAAQKILAPQAVQAALLWRFEPARRNGQRVNSESLLKFDFERK